MRSYFWDATSSSYLIGCGKGYLREGSWAVRMSEKSKSTLSELSKRFSDSSSSEDARLRRGLCLPSVCNVSNTNNGITSSKGWRDTSGDWCLGICDDASVTCCTLQVLYAIVTSKFESRRRQRVSFTVDYVRNMSQRSASWSIRTENRVPLMYSYVVVISQTTARYSVRLLSSSFLLSSASDTRNLQGGNRNPLIPVVSCNRFGRRLPRSRRWRGP